MEKTYVVNKNFLLPNVKFLSSNVERIDPNDYYEEFKKYKQNQIKGVISDEKLKELSKDKNVKIEFFVKSENNDMFICVKVTRYTEEAEYIDTERTTEKIIEVLSECGYDMSNYMDDEGYGVDFCKDLIELLNNKYDDNIKPKRVKRLCSSDLYRYIK